MKAFVSIIILLCSLGLAYGLYSNKPVSKKKKPKSPVPVVETMALKKSSEKVYLEAYGSVIPARKLEIRSEVDGRIVQLNPEVVPGGIVKKGDLLVEIDAVQYKLYVIELQADVAKAEYELELEKGQQIIARQEWQLLEQELESTEASRTLALREPHLKQAEVRLEAAKSKLAAAQLDVGRTKLKAPFNALVLRESVEIEQLVSRQSSIITLVDIDTFWIQVSVPFTHLNRIEFFGDDQSEPQKITAIWEQDIGPDIVRTGSLFKLLGDLDPKGQMARLLVTLDDPFNLSKKLSGKILLGSFTKVNIEAGLFEDVYAIPRSAMGDGYIWLVNSEDKLEKVEVKILWSRENDLLISADFDPQSRLVTSRLLSPLAGMRVMTGHNSSVVKNQTPK